MRAVLIFFFILSTHLYIPDENHPPPKKGQIQKEESKENRIPIKEKSDKSKKKKEKPSN